MGTFDDLAMKKRKGFISPPKSLAKDFERKLGADMQHLVINTCDTFAMANNGDNIAFRAIAARGLFITACGLIASIDLEMRGTQASDTFSEFVKDEVDNQIARCKEKRK